MKKFFKFTFCIVSVFCLMFCFAGCDLSSSDEADDKTKSEKIIDDDQQEESGELILEANTPQWWVDLYTFENVTVFLKNNLTIKIGDTYKCIGGQWYKKAQNTTTFESHSGRYIFDLFLTHYSVFTFNNEESRYEAVGVSFDNSNYTHEIYITVNGSGKITYIIDTATYNTSVIWTTIEVSDYGTTTLE